MSYGKMRQRFVNAIQKTLGASRLLVETSSICFNTMKCTLFVLICPANASYLSLSRAVSEFLSTSDILP